MAKSALKWPSYPLNTLGPDYTAWLQAVFESNGQKKSLMDREELLKRWTRECEKQLPNARQSGAIAQLSRVCSTTLDDAFLTEFTGV